MVVLLSEHMPYTLMAWSQCCGMLQGKGLLPVIWVSSAKVWRILIQGRRTGCLMCQVLEQACPQDSLHLQQLEQLQRRLKPQNAIFKKRQAGSCNSSLTC